MSKALKQKLSKSIADQIRAKIAEGGTGRFEMPFLSQVSGQYRNIVSGKAYRGINVLMCGLFGGGDTLFATYGQWQEMCFGERGKEVDNPLLDAKGKGVPIVYTQWKDKLDKLGDPTGEQYPLFRYSTVFGSSMLDPEKIPDKLAAKLQQDMIDSGTEQMERAAHIDEYIENTGATIVWNGTKACYYPSRDTIEMPAARLWIDRDGYYPVLFHELTHWTKHESRCDRKSCKAWGDRDYAFEELIAEIGSAMLCNMTGLSATVRDDHVQYIEGWLTRLESDHDYIFKAAELAQKAVDYIEAKQEVTA